jgi:hypothetical protein
MLREKLSTTIYEVDTSTRRRQIEAPRIDLRSRNPMVVEEYCLVTCDGEGACTHAGASWKKGILPIARS